VALCGAAVALFDAISADGLFTLLSVPTAIAAVVFVGALIVFLLQLTAGRRGSG
jgi:hypothetical protein